MLKKLPLILSVFVLLLGLAACGNNEEIENNDNGDGYGYENAEPTLEDLRAAFELFFEENKEAIIETVATDGEDVRLELAEGYEFIMTILLDDIELDNENRATYILAFELTFSQMFDLFGGLAEDIRYAAEVEHFRLTVIFVDVNEAVIARSNFDADARGGWSNSDAESNDHSEDEDEADE